MILINSTFKMKNLLELPTSKSRFLGCHMYFLSFLFCNQTPNGLGGHSGRFHFSHQGNRGFSLIMKKVRDVGSGLGS